MKLSTVIADLRDAQLHAWQDVEIRGLAYDTRRMPLGALFVAVPGTHVDGRAFIAEAVAAGAAAIVTEEDIADPGAPWLRVPDSRRALALLANAWHGYPSRRLKLIGVTGTDGKTTTTTMISQMLERAGQTVGYATTVDFKIGPREWSNATRQSTQEAPEVQALLAEMAAASVDWAVLETTSHALALDRVAGCAYDIAVVTNVTSEHLELHGTREAYLEAKFTLLRMLAEGPDKGVGKTAVLNRDDSSYGVYQLRCPVPILSYGLDEPADVMADDVELRADGSTFRVNTPVGSALVDLPLMGRFNVYNALAALTACIAARMPLDALVDGLGQARGVRGRMQRVAWDGPFTVIVDYAHTEESLRKVLSILRPLTDGKLRVVFGSAGDRDRQKRPAMGAVAARLADFAVIADEDPRFEDRVAILREIAAGAEAEGWREGRDFLLIADRRQAIRECLARCEQGDVVLLAGKGHEQCIIVGDEKTPWDEYTVAREELERRS